jgi:type IV pilus secretin PilQ/predicted competence protein
MEFIECFRRKAVVSGASVLIAIAGCAPHTELVPPGEEFPVASDSTTSLSESAVSINQAESVLPVQDSSENVSADKGSFNGQVLGLSLESVAPGSNILVADISHVGEASLKKTAASEYVLSIPGASFDKYVVGTVVAEPGGGLIRSVRPVSDNDGTRLRIFAQPGSALSLKQGSDKIVVGADFSATQDELRAQNAPEKALESQKTETVKPSAAGSAPPANSPASSVATNAATATGAASGTPDPYVEGAASDLGEDTDLSALFEEERRYVGRLISLDLQDTDIDNALRIIAEVSNLNIIASDDVTGKVTLRLIDVPWDQALDVILKTNGLDKVQEGNVIRIAPVDKLRQEREALKQATQAQEELEPLQVRYMRVSYARAAELRALVEEVVTERGSVAYDERTNQLIIKDIAKGLKNASVLVGKLDLRTPQVLIETQIVEANRSLVRDLGARFGFNFQRSPDFGNQTGWNFPNSIGVDGTTNDANNGINPSHPIINILLGSADGSKTITGALTAYEQEGRARIISRPAVSTTNNRQATIRSIQRVRVRTPAGGVSVATGSGAQAAGTSAIATEQIEVGIVLEVTPQASPDYYVLLDVNAKSSTLGQAGPDGIPIEIERSSTSSVLVSSGQTFAMGGIYKISDRDQLDGVPFFKDIPVLGTFFRTSRIDNSDEELIFFLTPRIIEGSFDDAAMKATT